MNPLSWVLLAALVVMSCVSLCMYGLDKWKARKGKWRISEKALLLSALFMGGPGALLGMHIFRHKTKHWYFRVLVPVFTIMNIALICAAMRWA